MTFLRAEGWASAETCNTWTKPATGMPVNRALVPDLLIATAWLAVLAAINQWTSYVIYSIIPYLFPAIYLGWRHNMAWGFVGAAMATLAAMPAGYPVQNPDEVLWAAGTTYLKLSCAVVGIRWGRSFGRARSMRR